MLLTTMHLQFYSISYFSASSGIKCMKRKKVKIEELGHTHDWHKQISSSNARQQSHKTLLNNCQRNFTKYTISLLIKRKTDQSAFCFVTRNLTVTQWRISSERVNDDDDLILTIIRRRLVNERPEYRSATSKRCFFFLSLFDYRKSRALAST